MIRPHWQARTGQGGVLNREMTERQISSRIQELLGSPELEGAACTGADPEVWYPAKGDSGMSKIARTICRGGEINGKRVPPCPVRAACLARALDMPGELTHYGTWAGYTAKKLSRMRRLRDALRICAAKDDAA